MANTDQAQSKEFFNLHVHGFGYLSRVRWVDVKGRGGRRSEPFLSCSINAIHGDANDPSYTYFDLNVSGAEAVDVIDSLQEAVDARKKVFVSFRASDIYSYMYERNVRDQQGRKTDQLEWASLIKGRLILIYSVTVDGVQVYSRPKDDERPQASGDGSHEQEPKAKETNADVADTHRPTSRPQGRANPGHRRPLPAHPRNEYAEASR